MAPTPAEVNRAEELLGIARLEQDVAVKLLRAATNKRDHRIAYATLEYCNQKVRWLRSLRDAWYEESVGYTLCVIEGHNADQELELWESDI